MEQVNSRFKKSVFISHASKNLKLADEVREGLEKHGVSCWIAPRDIPPGYQYGTAIVEALRDCTITLLVLTDEANMSKPVENEIERAFGYQKVIVPLRIRDIKPATGLEFFVSNAQWVDAIKSPIKSRIEQIVNIVHAIEMGKSVPVPMPEKRTLMGTVERFLEQAFRHKVTTALSGFVILASLSVAGLLIQSQTHWDLSGIDTKLAKVKLETSSDPRKELVNLGSSWSPDNFIKSVEQNDSRIMELFLENGILDDPEAQRVLNIILRRMFKNSKEFNKNRKMIEFFHAKGIDYIRDFEPDSSAFLHAPLASAFHDKSTDAFDWLLANNDLSRLPEYYRLMEPSYYCDFLEEHNSNWWKDQLESHGSQQLDYLINEAKLRHAKLTVLAKNGVRPKPYILSPTLGNSSEIDAIKVAKEKGCYKFLSLFSQP